MAGTDAPNEAVTPTANARAAQSVFAPPRRGWLAAGVFITILSAYLLGESRTPPYNDSKFIYTVAESIVLRKAIDIPVPGGKLYAQHPLLPSAIHIPGVALRKTLAKDDPVIDHLVKPMTSHIGTQLMVVTGCLVFFRLLVFLGLSLATASLGTVTLAFATFLPIYARTTWSEAVQATCFIGFYSALLRLRDRPGRRTGIWFGIWTGLLVNSKYAFVLALPGAALFLLVSAWRARRLRPLLRALAWPLVPGGAFLVVILWYNWARTGATINSGYPTLAGLAETVFRESLFVGLWSYAFSFGKSLFLYNPPLVLSVLAMPLVWRRDPAVLWALLLTAGPLVCLYSKFVFWSGDWCWGPRYLLFVVAPLLVPAVMAFEEALRAKRRVLVAIATGLFVLGVVVQVVGASQYWDHFIRISRIVQGQWLGAPNRAGALTADHGGGCDPCFEDFYARNFTPAFQPIEGQWWYVRHHLKDDPWEVAVKDLPLHRYTNLDFASVRDWYLHPAWDWWKLDFTGRYQRTGDLLLGLFWAGLVVGLFLWLRGLRPPTGPSARTAP